ncbi:MAG: adenosine deaminase [candidate division KSB1 bacterium]|nr:adenosine deaminase [candidate division KSB1 bacterium]
MKITRDLLFELPKTDLHVHLDGSLRVKTAIELAKAKGIPLPSDNEDEVRDFLSVKGQVENLKAYIDKFDFTLKLLQDAESLRRVAYELAEDASKEHVTYMEVRYSPILHQQEGLSLTQIVDAVLEGLRQAERDFPIRCGVIICGIRSIDPATSVRLAELAVQYKRKAVVGFDLAGSEYNYPAKDHAKAFYIIRKNCVNCTAHAGEAYGPDSIHQAIPEGISKAVQKAMAKKRTERYSSALEFIQDLRAALEAAGSIDEQVNFKPEEPRKPAPETYHLSGAETRLNHIPTKLNLDSTVTPIQTKDTTLLETLPQTMQAIPTERRSYRLLSTIIVGLILAVTATLFAVRAFRPSTPPMTPAVKPETTQTSIPEPKVIQAEPEPPPPADEPKASTPQQNPLEPKRPQPQTKKKQNEKREEKEERKAEKKRDNFFKRMFKFGKK